MSITLLETTSTQIALELANLAQQLKNSTVQIRSDIAGVGSGVIWHSHGLIITNAHVAQTATVTVELEDGRIFPALRTGIDPHLDLATLQIDATDLPAAPLGDSDMLRVGELVLAVGNPLGAVGVLTAGIIQRISLTSPLNRDFVPTWVMADIRLAPGNSGGLLANARGQVIGINTMIAGGLALAIPSNLVERFLCLGSRPYLGVTMRPVLVLQRRFGLLLLNVEKGSLAEVAGLMAGDVLLGAFGQSFRTADDLLNLLWHSEAGEVVPLEFLRTLKHHYCDLKIPGNKPFAGVKSP